MLDILMIALLIGSTFGFWRLALLCRALLLS